MRATRALAGALAALAVAAAAGPATGTFAVPESGIVPVTINGTQMRFAVSPDGLSYPVLNPDVAERLKLRSSMFSVRARVGPVSLSGRTGVVRIDAGEGEERRRSLWFERPVAAGSDGMLGPAAFDAPTVTFRLAAPRAGERRTELPLVESNRRMGTVLGSGDAAITVLFNLMRGETLATASAASTLATSNGGAFRGEPAQQVIRFGVARPVRRVEFARPVTVGPLAIGALLARTGDYGSTAGIADGDPDPGEIVVTADGRRQDADRTLVIGRDALAGCSTLSFDKAAARIVLSCAP